VGCIFHYPKNLPWTCELEKHPDTCGSARLEAPIPSEVVMDQLEIERIQFSVINESVRQLGPQYVALFKKLLLEANEATKWGKWAIDTLVDHDAKSKVDCEAVLNVNDEFVAEEARTALSKFMRDLVRATAILGPKELSKVEKKYIVDKLGEVCGGTPLQANAEFASGYLGSVVISMLENWGIIKEQLRAPTDKAADPALQWVVRGREEILVGPDGEALAYVRKTRSKIENFNYADGYVSASTDIAQVKKELEERHAEDSGG